MLCECGCGQPTNIARQDNPRFGHVKGQPLRFLVGHATRVKAKVPLADRFWAKVNKTDSCWLWTASRSTYGYGQMAGDGYYANPVLAHRVSWELHNGPIPEGVEVCHNCPGGDNPLCVNPTHLFLGSHQANLQDWSQKRRFRVTECAKGHPYSPENTYIIPKNGRRRCRLCHANR